MRGLSLPPGPCYAPPGAPIGTLGIRMATDLKSPPPGGADSMLDTMKRLEGALSPHKSYIEAIARAVPTLPHLPPEVTPVMLTPKIELPQDPRLANAMCGRLVEQIKDFEANLSENEEVGARLAAFGSSILLHIRDISWHNPDLLILEGVIDGSGDRAKLMQHVSQTNLLLVAVRPPAGQKPVRVGFNLDEPESP